MYSFCSPASVSMRSACICLSRGSKKKGHVPPGSLSLSRSLSPSVVVLLSFFLWEVCLCGGRGEAVFPSSGRSHGMRQHSVLHDVRERNHDLVPWQVHRVHAIFAAPSASACLHTGQIPDADETAAIISEPTQRTVSLKGYC